MFDHNTTAATLRTHSLTARHTQYVSTRHPITVQKRTVLLWFVHWKHDRGTVGAGAATPTRETCRFLIKISPFRWLQTKCCSPKTKQETRSVFFSYFYGCRPSSPLPLQIGIQSRTPNLISEKPDRHVNSMKHHGTNGREADFVDGTSTVTTHS